jgi:hypothetical protein
MAVDGMFKQREAGPKVSGFAVRRAMRRYARWQTGNPFLATTPGAAGMRRAGRLAGAMILHARTSGFRLRYRHDGDRCHSRNGCSPGDERRRREEECRGSHSGRAQD